MKCKISSITVNFASKNKINISIILHKNNIFHLFSQDIYRFDRRQVTAKVPLNEIPFIMRALGFYPTEQEVSPIFLA